MGRGGEGREGGREEIRTCIVDFLKSGVFSSCPSLAPHPRCGVTVKSADWAGSRWEFGDVVPTADWGPFCHMGHGCSPAGAPRPPQPSAPTSTGQKEGHSGLGGGGDGRRENWHSLLALGHMLWAKLWQPGEVPSPWPEISSSSLQTSHCRFPRQPRGPWGSAGTPLPQETGCGRKPTDPGETRLPVKCAASQPLSPTGSPFPRKLFLSIPPSLKPTTPGAAPRWELTGRFIPGRGQASAPCRPAPPERRGCCPQMG